MSGIILEGVTGAGKSSTIRALRSLASFDLVDEEETFGDFMAEFSVDADSASQGARDSMRS